LGQLFEQPQTVHGPVRRVVQHVELAERQAELSVGGIGHSGSRLRELYISLTLSIRARAMSVPSYAGTVGTSLHGADVSDDGRYVAFSAFPSDITADGHGNDRLAANGG